MTGQDLVFPDDKIIMIGTKLFMLLMDYTLLRKYKKVRVFPNDEFIATVLPDRD